MSPVGSIGHPAGGLELRGVAVGYRRRGRRPDRTTTVAEGLVATARRGELTVLLGPNGSGKSTLLRTLAGLQPSLAGQVLFDGQDLTGLAADELARRVAVVLTDRVDAGLLSARELAGLGRTPHLGFAGRLGARDHEVVAWALAAVGAGALADRPAGELSDGERQRVLTARALAQEPSLLVLDEPTAFLDVPSRVGLVELLRRLADERDLAVLMSTHDLELALRVADRVWLLGRDHRLTSGTPEQLALSGLIADTFDRGSLRFDAASGVFSLRPAPGAARTTRVEAQQPLASALGRMLSRAGWQLVARGPAELALTAFPDGSAVLRHDGRTIGTSDLDELWLAVRRRTPTGLQACDPVDIRATLGRVAETGPYFTVGTGPAAGPGWHPVRRLYDDPVLLEALVDRLRARLGAAEQRVAVSTLFLGYAARLWSVGLGGLVSAGCAPDLDPDLLLWNDDDGAVRLHVEQPQGWQGAGFEDVLHRHVVQDHLGPLITAVHRLGPLSDRLLWGNAGSALLGAARVLDGSTPGPAAAVAARLLGRGPLAGTVDLLPGGGHRRHSCCLYYRLPGAGVCGDCTFTTPPTVRDQESS